MNAIDLRPEGMQLVRQDLECPRAPLVSPNTFAYLHIAAELEKPRPSPRCFLCWSACCCC